MLALTRGDPGVYNIADDDGAVALTKARAVLGFEPAVSFAQGIPGLVAELAEQLHEDHSARAEAELWSRGLAARAE